MPVRGTGIHKVSSPQGESRGTNIHKRRKQSVKRGKNTEKRKTSKASKPPSKALPATPGVSPSRGNSGPTNQLKNF